jgi:hypothetical protein
MLVAATAADALTAMVVADPGSALNGMKLTLRRVALGVNLWRSADDQAILTCRGTGAGVSDYFLVARLGLPDGAWVGGPANWALIAGESRRRPLALTFEKQVGQAAPVAGCAGRVVRVVVTR